MIKIKCNKKFIIKIIFLLLPTMQFSQTTEVIKKANMYVNPGDTKTILGKIYPGSEIRKIKKDQSGKFVIATVKFYIPIEALREGRISMRVGESQIADDATIKLIKAQKKGDEILVVIDITNTGDKDMDMSALLLTNVMGRDENMGNLEFMRSNNSIGVIAPGKTLRSELVYSFKKTPENVEFVFQSKMGGDKVFFMLGF